MSKNKMNSKPQRAQGGKGLLSRSISVQHPQEFIPLIHRDEREEEKRGEGGGRRQAEELLACCPGKKEREGEGVFNPNNSQPKRLNYP
jgi:hypothetical protein